ncbi:MAG TPA: hypothetical protein VKZ18_08185 [Polyangia bacterium]|nr:hypothetical protein [Polyangia bacterium]
MVKTSIRNITLGLFGSLTVMLSVARAAEPEVAPSLGGTAPVASQPTTLNVHPAPDVELAPQVAADVRAAIEDVLAGRAQPAVPIDVTLEAGAAVVRVGSLSRRIAIAGWDYSAARTVALHVLDLLQPGPEVPDVATASPTTDPAGLVPEADVTSRPADQTTDTGNTDWSLHAAVAGSRGAQGPDPWFVSSTIGAAWTRDWLRLGLEVGWDHAIVRHPDGMTTVNYDAVPLRLVVAAQNNVVMGGIRAGGAWYRLTSQLQPYTELTPLVGPFLAAKFPIGGRFRGLLVGGFDYFARRTQLSTGNFDTAYSSPQVAPYVGVVVDAVLEP